MSSGGGFPQVPFPTGGVDPRVALATGIHSSPSVYALLVGSGMSSAAGIKTGWQVVQDLVRKVAVAEGVDLVALGQPPEGWWVSQGHPEPRYDTLLPALASTDAARQALLGEYFDPPPGKGGPIVPTPGHKALAWLCASGRVRVILTTNFDRLIERALEQAGVAPQVIASPDEAKGMTLFMHAPVTVVKLHGDYSMLGHGLRNTPEELGSYPEEWNRLLARVFDEFGLVVVGWSATYDIALYNALAASPSRRYPVFWASYNGNLTESAKRLIAQRQAAVINTGGADEFLDDLAQKIDRLDQRARRPRRLTTALRIHRLMPDRSTPQGWAVLPLLLLRAAAAIGPAFDADGFVGPQQREDIVAALNAATITSRLHLLSSTTAASAISPDSPMNSDPLGVWQPTPDAYQSAEAGSYRLGGDAAAGISALARIQSSGLGANAGSIVVLLDIGLSLMGQIRLAEAALLLRDGLVLTTAALPMTLDAVLPIDAEVTLSEIHISAPTTTGDTNHRDNELQKRLDLSSLGSPTRPLQPEIGFAAELTEPLGEVEATELVAGAFERMALANGYIDPRIGIAALRHELGLPTV